ncbi:SDR family NAD(P)-dependent oxidoreductase [Niveispirillum sp. KHB5.9]|uniref:SDR family NAD(P)-dependent oxidoreductase n=1 Tax=Niveispirillum sp. KHB5.9 TaxID=3400269 RepID=UPI003A8B7661
MDATDYGRLFDLSGRTALVTGGQRGLGLGIATALAKHGASVWICCEDEAAGEAVSVDLRTQGLAVQAIACDVTDRVALAAMVERVGRLDILVCNAGVAPHAGPIATASDTDWQATMSINLQSVLWLTGLVLPGMADAGGGSVIIMSSIAGLRGNKALGLYGLSKAANAQLARNLAVEWGPSNIRVNAISPGFIRTDLARDLLANPAFMEKRMAMTPLRRPGEVAEVAGVALMLASPAGGFVTGQNIVVDGGTLITDGN